MIDLLWSERRETEQDVVRNDTLVAALVVLAYVLHTKSGIPWPKAMALFAVLGALTLRPRFLQAWGLWAAVGGLLLVDIVRLPYHIANHHYVLTYISFALALSMVADPRHAIRLLRTNARWLMVGLMGFAVIHKLCAPAYLDGSYLAYMIGDGNLGDTLLGYCTSCSETAQANNQAIAQFMSEPPLADPVPLTSPLPGVSLITAGRWGAVAVIAAELWLVLTYALVPRHRITHVSALLFVGGLAFVRQELVFISAVTLLALLGCEGHFVRIRRLLAFAVLLFVTLSLAGVDP